MKLQVIDFGHNSDLPSSVRGVIEDDTLQSLFRTCLNSHLREGKSEMLAYSKAWRAMSDMGFGPGPDGKWIQNPVEKDSPGVGDVHVDRPLGSDEDEEPLFVPPVEVQAAAKRAMENGHERAEFTAKLAKGEGIDAEEVRQIAAHFGGKVTSTNILLYAFGGPHGARWAARVVKKLDKDAEQARLDAEQGIDKGEVACLLGGKIVKVDAAQHLVFGWASICEIEGRPVTDTQGDQILPATIEESAYDFVLNSRVAGEMHEGGKNGIAKIGQLVESMVFTAGKTPAMLQSLTGQGINAVMDMPFCGWWIGFKVTDPDTWAAITAGQLVAFSIGGKGKRAAL